jgi:hypothetical protein
MKQNEREFSLIKEKNYANEKLIETDKEKLYAALTNLFKKCKVYPLRNYPIWL